MTKAIDGLGGLDILVSNAARQQEFPQITDMPDEEFDWIVKTNIYAPFYILKAAIPHMQPGSTIIATASNGLRSITRPVRLRASPRRRR